MRRIVAMSMQGELFSSSNKSIFFVILDSGVFSWSVLDNEVQVHTIECISGIRKLRDPKP